MSCRIVATTSARATPLLPWRTELSSQIAVKLTATFCVRKRFDRCAGLFRIIGDNRAQEYVGVDRNLHSAVVARLAALLMASLSSSIDSTAPFVLCFRQPARA